MYDLARKLCTWLLRLSLGGTCVLMTLLGIYESIVVRTISDEFVQEASTPDELIDNLLQGTTRLLNPRYDIYHHYQDENRTLWLPSVLGQLLFPSRDCGGYSEVFRYLAYYQGIETRLVQMLCPPKNLNACHIIVEVKVNDVWYPVDPLYGMRFRGANNAWLTFDEIRASWETVKSQAPDDYLPIYIYAEKRHVNWGKNALTRLMRTILLLGLEPAVVDTIPLRSFYYSFLNLLAGLALMLLISFELLLLIGGILSKRLQARRKK